MTTIDGDDPGDRPELREHERAGRDQRAGDDEEEEPEQAAEPPGPALGAAPWRWRPPCATAGIRPSRARRSVHAVALAGPSRLVGRQASSRSSANR